MHPFRSSHRFGLALQSVQVRALTTLSALLVESVETVGSDLIRDEEEAKCRPGPQHEKAPSLRTIRKPTGEQNFLSFMGFFSSKQLKSPRRPQSSRGFSLAAVPADLREMLQELDLDKSGYIEASEILAAAQSLSQSREQNRFLRRFACLTIFVLLLFCVVIFGLTYAVVLLTREVDVSEDDPTLRVVGTDTPVLVGSNDFVVLEDGSLVPRDAEDSLVISGDP
eukprot:scaffold406_cov162-Pinguiococcus_pyrenoidosus.AAC.1